MTEKLIITITYENQTITVGDNTCRFKLLAHSGFAAADFDVQMSAGGSFDGGYITAARLSSRTLDIKFDFGGRDGEVTRQTLIHFFAPHRLLTITAKRGTVRREITGHAVDFDITETNRHARSVVSLSILCPDPYFKATNAMFLNAPKIHQFFCLPCRMPCALGSDDGAGEIAILNNGDTHADMVAELVAHTEVAAPYIRNNTNGRKILIKESLQSGDRLIISTVRRAKTATINGTRCLIDPSSQFSDFLEPGLNHIVCGSDIGEGVMAANVQYTALYLGV